MTIHGRRAEDEVEPLLVRTREAQRLLGIGQTCFWQLVLRGEIPVVRLGRRTLVARETIHAIVAGRGGQVRQ
jgi:excisionase family DNA binding protein